MRRAVELNSARGRCWRKIALAACLSAPLSMMADVVTVSGGGSVPAYSPCGFGNCNAGVYMSFQVKDGGGTPDYGVAALWDSANWELVSIPDLQPNLPPGSTVNSATLSFTDKAWAGQADGNIALYTSTSSQLTSVNLTESCGNGRVEIAAPAASGSVTFIPCGPSFSLGADFSGTSFIGLTGWDQPQTPGYYYADDFLFEQVDYSLAVDYTPPLPEPGFFVLTGLGTFGLLAIAILRKIRA